MRVAVEGIFIALGANLDKPVQQVNKAMDDLDALEGLSVIRRSSLYASSPMGPADQPDYINAVCELTCSLEPLALLDQLMSLEHDAGRTREGGKETRWGARLLDLDLALFGQQVINEPRLTVPHPGLLVRSFVLVPLLEIAPEVVVPGSGLARDYLSVSGEYNLTRLDSD